MFSQTRWLIMENTWPRYFTIGTKTGIVCRPSLFLSLFRLVFFSLFLPFFLPIASAHNSRPVPASGPIQSEDINNKIWYNGEASPERNTIQCLCRGLSDVARSREKYRPRWDRTNVRHADSWAGLLQRWPAGNRGRWSVTRALSFDPRFWLARGRDLPSRLGRNTIFRDGRNNFEM